MAGASGTQFDPHSYLSPNQQDLLLAALSSNMNGNKNQFSASNPDLTAMNGQAQQQFSGAALDPSFFTSPQHNGSLSTFDSFGVDVDDSPYVDFADGDFDFGDMENDDEMIGPLPGEGDIHDKRKSPDDSANEGENGAKRQEGEDKQAKKPGRKPLTSEPTTKRKAQNRAAQRAFRERKEKHLKDLETKVADLEKQSEAEKHENGLLRAQVERLQTELREYRKRLSLNSGRLGGGSPPVHGLPSYLAGVNNSANGTNGSANSFQFEFPKFGGLPGAHIFSNGALSKQESKSTPNLAKASPANGVLLRKDSSGRSLSPKAQANRTNSSDQPQTNRSNTDSSTPSRVFQFNSNSNTSNSGSPSASSNSQFGGANSSCGTSPEPSHNSPSHKDGNPDQVNAQGYVCYGNSEGEISFCEKLNMACGNPRNPVPRAMSSSNANTPAPTHAVPATTAAKPPGAASDINNGIDFMANQNGGQFDPALFGDYRESNAAIVGDGDFTGGFFNDAFAMPDFGSPFNVGETPAIQKSNPMEEIEKLQDAADVEEVVPGEDMSQMLSCHKIWDKLQANPGFKDGSFDIDGLCSELRAKARCSESGVVVDQKDVEEAIKRMPSKSVAP